VVRSVIIRILCILIGYECTTHCRQRSDKFTRALSQNELE
jgi:hypothetical protein